MTAWYNEPDPYAAQWLRNLIAAGHIAPGVIDERPIQEVEPFELSGFTQCHFFAGIGVWSHALRRAGWPDDQPIWTGSCPCQPFSAAGKQKGFSDDRHLWPYWKNLIDVCKPAIVVGEQVASALEWLDLVSSEMEAAGYAFGASDLCAAGFGGAHIRQRLYFVGLVNTEHNDRWADEPGRGSDRGTANGGAGGALRLADHDDAGLERRLGMPERGDQRALGPGGVAGAAHAPMLGREAADWLFCRDGKWRPVEPSSFPLAHAAPARVGRLRAYGNALDAETASNFLAAVADIAGIRSLILEYDL